MCVPLFSNVLGFPFSVRSRLWKINDIDQWNRTLWMRCWGRKCIWRCQQKCPGAKFKWQQYNLSVIVFQWAFGHTAHTCYRLSRQPKIVSVRLNRCGQTDSVVVYSGPNSYICGAFAHKIFSPEMLIIKYSKRLMTSGHSWHRWHRHHHHHHHQPTSSIGGLDDEAPTIQERHINNNNSLRYIFSLFFLGVFCVCVWNFITSFGGCPLCMCLLLCSFEKLFTVRMRDL